VQTKSSKGRGEARINQSCNVGWMSEFNSQQPLASDLPEEDQAQLI
jgi:hypothetical protein